MNRTNPFSHRAIATFIEVLAFCIDFSTHYKNTYMFKTADVYCSEITFFHNDALLSKGTRKLFCTKSVREK